ncbi:MAG: DUF192 domain-containing protein [Treponema sp.]|nr:DUF192 domain-containing protein [Treponema sp.]
MNSEKLSLKSINCPQIIADYNGLKFFDLIRKIRVNPWIFLLFFLASCTSNETVFHNVIIERDGKEIAVVKAEIARTPEEHMQGLMFREKLPDGEGMLFIFETDRILSFWMKNTLVPLSIAYITSEGIIIDIKNMYPHDTTSVYSSRSVRYALEVPQGWFSRVGVKEGDRVNIDAFR